MMTANLDLYRSKATATSGRGSQGYPAASKGSLGMHGAVLTGHCNLSLTITAAKSVASTLYYPLC